MDSAMAIVTGRRRSRGSCNILTLGADLNDPACYEELAPWLRVWRHEALRHRDGLDARCMRLPAPEYALVKALPGLLQLPIIGACASAWLSGRPFLAAASRATGW